MVTQPQPGSTSKDEAADGEIVVAIPHVHLVTTVIGPTAQEVERNARLGLARLRITDVAEAAARFAPAVAARRRSTTASAAAWTAGDDLDVVLSGVRLQLADIWAGWCPVIGKNRSLPLGGEGWPYIVAKSATAPAPSDRQDEPYAGLPASVAADGGKGRVIGLLDTGVSAAVAREISADESAVICEATSYDYRVGHGTFTVGLVRQYAPEAEVRLRRVLVGPESTASSWDFAAALLTLVDPDGGAADAGGSPAVDFVVLPLGCVTADSDPPLVIQRAVDLVRDRVVLLAASGNHGRLTMAQMRDVGITRVTPMWPAALDGVAAVGSERRDGRVSDFTPQSPWVDFLSPGEDLNSTYLDGSVDVPDADGRLAPLPFTGFARWSGTSMAAAIAAARLACVATPGESPHDALARVRGAGTEFLRPTTSW